jgi:hypothetical protein
VHAASGKTYVVVKSGVAVGAATYTDRTYVMLSPLPSVVQQATYIRTANNVKISKPGMAAFLTFSVDRNVTVYVAHDNRLAVPHWLGTTFTRVSGTVVNSDYYGKQFLSLFKKDFAKGTVTLGSNVDRAANGNMYMVMVETAGAPTLTTDKTAPVVTISSPKNGSTVSGTVTITASASDNTKVMGVQFLVDGKDVGSEDTSSPYSLAWTSKGVANGTHTIGAIARDAAGNRSAASVSVSVSNATTIGSPPPTGSTAPGSGTHSGWYASPTGSSGASGTASAPWDLATALGGGHGKVQPGDTIWLRGGTYGAGDNSTVYTSALTGTSTQPIIVRQYPGERATLNANLAVNGAYTWYMDFEVANTQTGPQSINGISHAGLGTKLIDLVVHDHTGNGIFTSEAAANSEIYGCLLYNNGSLGQSAADRAHGIYAQNLTGTKVLRDNIIFQTYAFGIHVYGQGGHLNNITVDGNVLFNNGMFNSNNFFLGGGQALVNLRFTNNMTYGVGGTGIIGEGTTSSGGVITGNYFVGPLLTITDWASLTFQHNTITQPNPWEIIILNAPSKTTLANYQWSDNTYYRLNTSGLPFTFQDHSLGTSTAYSFAGWQGLGIDAGSDYSELQQPPVKVVVEPDQYEPGRAIVVVYNWNGQGSAAVDLSNVLQSGDHYVVHNAEEYYGAPVASGTYGGAVTLPLSAVSPPTPVAGWSTNRPTASATFNTFIVQKTN